MSGQFLAILQLSLLVSGTAVALSAGLGIPLGLWLGLKRFAGKRLVTALVYTGMALPPVVVGLLFYLLLSRSGPLGRLEWLYTPQAMILVQTILGLPFVVGIVMGAVSAVSPELPWQLRALGASEGQVRWELIREVRPAMLLAIATALGRSLSEVGAVWLVGGNIEGHTRVFTTAIVLETGMGNFGLALALGAVLVAIALTLNLVILQYQPRAAS